MKKLLAASITAAVLGTAGLGFAAPAGAAPIGVGSAQAIISDLQARGYVVILSKVGSDSLDRCTVTSVQPGSPVTQRVSDRRGQSLMQVRYTPAYVQAEC